MKKIIVVLTALICQAAALDAPGQEAAPIEWTVTGIDADSLGDLQAFNIAGATPQLGGCDPTEPPEIEWQASFGGWGFDKLTSTEQTADGGYVLGGFSSSGGGGNKTSPCWGGEDFWVIRLDEFGSKLWEQSFGGTAQDCLWHARQTSDGGFVLVGYSASAANGNKMSPNWGGQDFWGIRLDEFGNKLWEQSFGGSADEAAWTVCETGGGGFVIGGTSWSAPGGNKTSPNFGSSDIWLVCLDAGGNKIWDQSFGGGGYELTRGLQQTSDGGFIVAGFSDSGKDGNKESPCYGGYDFWLIRLDAAGNKIWDRSYGGSGND